MSESTRGIIYRVLAVVFFALVTFGFITAEEAESYTQSVVELVGLVGFLLASRNTTGIGGK